MLKQNKKDKQDRHRWLLIGFLCLFGVCLVAQVRPTEQKTKATGTSTKSVADTSKTTKKQPENKKTKVYLLHADEGQEGDCEREGDGREQDAFAGGDGCGEDSRCCV